MMVIDNKFDFGDKVYLETDVDQKERVVTEFRVTKTGILYSLSCGVDKSWHYDFEITTEKNVLITSTN